ARRSASGGSGGLFRGTAGHSSSSARRLRQLPIGPIRRTALCRSSTGALAPRSFLADPLSAPKLRKDTPSAVVVHRSADGWDTTHWRESSCATLRAAAHGCVPTGRRPAKLADAVQENLCGSALASATRETARLFLAFAGAVCRSSTTESLGASTTATVW